MISGLLLIKWTWPSIFWFLSIASPLVFLIMFLFLPETCRRLVGNGSRLTSRVHTPLIPILRPEQYSSLVVQQEKQKDVLPKLPNPLSVLLLLKDRATLAAVLCYGIYYTVHSCLQASTSTLFVTVYQLSGLRAGLIYIPFGVACSISSIIAGTLFPSLDFPSSAPRAISKYVSSRRENPRSRLSGRCQSPRFCDRSRWRG